MKRTIIQIAVAPPGGAGDPDLLALCNDGTLWTLTGHAQWVEMPAIPQPIEGECEARQHSDQMLCKRCDIGWDMNDPHPPTCGQIAKGK